MASTSNSMVEGQSTLRPPLFDGTNYQYWSTRMSIFIRACDYRLWDVIEDGPYVPMKEENGIRVPKERREWSEVEMRNVQINYKAINTLYCALNSTEFNRVSTCTSAKEIWEKLRIIHEGTSQIKESKIALLTHSYEVFKMRPHEGITRMLDRFNEIANQLKHLGKEIPEHELVKRLLRSLPKDWKPKVIAIREAKNLNNISLDALCGSLLTHELEMDEEEEEEMREAKVKMRNLALKVSALEEELDCTSSDEDDEELTILAEKIKRIMGHRGKRQERRFLKKDEGTTWRSKDKKEVNKGSKMICFECDKPGHFKSNCPQLKGGHSKKYKKQKKAMVAATWSDSDYTTSDDDLEIEEKANLCSIAKEDNIGVIPNLSNVYKFY